MLRVCGQLCTKFMASKSMAEDIPLSQLIAYDRELYRGVRFFLFLWRISLFWLDTVVFYMTSLPLLVKTLVVRHRIRKKIKLDIKYGSRARSHLDVYSQEPQTGVSHCAIPRSVWDKPQGEMTKNHRDNHKVCEHNMRLHAPRHRRILAPTEREI